MKKLQKVLISGLIVFYILIFPLTVLDFEENNIMQTGFSLDENGNIIIQYLTDSDCKPLVFQDGYNNTVIQILKGVDNNNLFLQSGYYNDIFLSQSGEPNQTHISQKGNNNKVVVKQKMVEKSNKDDIQEN